MKQYFDKSMKNLILELEARNLFLVSVIILCISLYINHRLKNAHRYALAAKIPGPPTLPFIGNAHSFIGLDMDGIFKRLLALKERYGFPQRFWFGPELWVMLMNPKDLKAVLTSENAVNKNSAYSFFKCSTDGQFVASGDEWRALRKLTNPTFHQKLLERFVRVFNRQSEILVEKLAAEVGQSAFDIKKYVSKCTLDMICETQMGVKTREQQENTSDFSNNLFKFTEIVLMRVFKVYLHPEFIFNLTQYHKENEGFIKPLHRFTEEVIRERMKTLATRSGCNEICNIDSDSDENRAIFLDNILKSFPDKNLNQLARCTLDMLIGGSDASASTISLTLLMLAMHPEYQEKVYKEQCDLFKNMDSPITMGDLNEMKYLEMVIKESLRICCPTSIIRQLTKDLQIENYTLPAGTIAYLSFYSNHRDRSYWEHPEEFYPDHFTPEALEKRPKYSFTPFSMGPRNCPGLKYGMLSMKAALSHVIRRYKFTTSLKMEELKYKMTFMLEPVQGYSIIMEER